MENWCKVAESGLEPLTPRQSPLAFCRVHGNPPSWTVSSVSVSSVLRTWFRLRLTWTMSRDAAHRQGQHDGALAGVLGREGLRQWRSGGLRQQDRRVVAGCHGLRTRDGELGIPGGWRRRTSARVRRTLGMPPACWGEAECGPTGGQCVADAGRPLRIVRGSRLSWRRVGAICFSVNGTFDAA